MHKMGKFPLLIWMASTFYCAQSLCPVLCNCRSDQLGRTTVSCLKGDMVSIPVEDMNRSNVLIVKIASPGENHPNVLTLGPIFTQPEPFKILKELHIVNSNIPSIGQYSFWGLKNLKVLNLSSNNLTSISDHNFRGLLDLRELYIDDNMIKIMSSETFRHLSELHTLSLKNNKISVLVPRVFRMLAKLSVLDLSGNGLFELNPEVFKDIQDVIVFRCRHCQLLRMNTQIYHLLSKLQILDLGDNSLKYVTHDEFVNLKRIKTIMLDGNRIPVITDNTFEYQKNLKLLTLAKNRIALLTPNAFSNLTSLETLDISFNNLDNFDLKTFAPIINSLTSINFSGNHNLLINEILPILQILPLLHSVGLANLSISQFPADAFDANPFITSLNISGNKLNYFPTDIFRKIKFLQDLDISRNNLQILNEESLMRLEAMSTVFIHDNPWNCGLCDINLMIVYMKTTVLNFTVRNLVCKEPENLGGLKFYQLTESNLDWCSDENTIFGSGFLPEEGQLSIFAGILLLCMITILVCGAGVYYTKRRTAEYYTNEEKSRANNERILMERSQLVYFCDNDDVNNCKCPKIEPPEKNLCAEGAGTVATIHAEIALR